MKLCDTCIYGSKTEYFKPCIIYRDDCEYYEKERGDMTREEKQKAIDALKISAPVMVVTQEEFNDYIQTLNQVMDWLEQEPCEDEYIKVPKKALKYRTAGMVAYNAEWLKNHFDIERAVICGMQEPCEVEAIVQAYSKGFEDCRQAVVDMAGLSDWFDSSDSYNEFVIALSDLPPVNPQEPKMWHWINDEIGSKCSCCGIHTDRFMKFNYCPNCGAKMVKPQESEDKE